MTPQTRVLVIDDELQMRRLLRMTLTSGGFQMFEASDGQSGLTECVSKKPDAVILDLGLPDMDGLEVLRKIRAWSQVPVLILSVREEEKQKVLALDGGADDYVTKPFGGEELLARLRVILRRSPEQEEASVFEDGDLTVNFSTRAVARAGKEVHLTVTEYSLLKLLIRHAGKVITHGQILREIWGPNTEERVQYLRVYVTHLRQKLEKDPEKPLRIRTEPGIGYRFCSAKL